MCVKTAPFLIYERNQLDCVLKLKIERRPNESKEQGIERLRWYNYGRGEPSAIWQLSLEADKN